MRLMLDTNTCIHLIKRKPPAIADRFKDYSVGDIGISSITLAELEFGVAKSRDRDRNRQALDEFVLPLEVAGFDERAAKAYGTIRSNLEGRGAPIGSLDTLIAAHAASLGVTLVTSNTREFLRVDNLAVVDWIS
jgi:tRNA(fMet)-specific endonuclease VapC